MTAKRNLTVPVLGELTYDEELVHFCGQVQWAGRPVRVTVPAGSDEQVSASAAAIAQVVERLDVFDARLRAYAAAELRELAGDWHGPGAAPSADEFAARIRLTELALDEDDGMEAWFADGGLFDGHVICVALDADGQLLEVDIHG